MRLRVETSRLLLIAAQLLLAVAYALPVLRAERVTHSDFLSFYTAGAIVRDGQGAQLYDLDLQGDYQAKALGLQSSNSHFALLPFINPPHAALIFTPIAYLPPSSAAWVFLTLNCLLAIWVLYRLWQLALGWSQAARILLITTTLATEVFWYNLGTGTMTLLVFACLIEYFLAMRDGRDISAAVWLIASTIKPQLMVLPALVPFTMRRWRLIGVAVSFTVIVGLGVSLAFGFHIWRDYLGVLSEVSAHGEKYGAVPMLMSNLRMILYWTVTPQAILPLVGLGLCGGVVVSVWLWRSTRDFGVRFSLTILLGVFLAPHLNYQDTLIAILPAALSYDFARTKRVTLVPAFQLLMLTATFFPALLLFTGYSGLLVWIWPLPVIVGLSIICARELSHKQLNAKPDLYTDTSLK